MEKTDTEERVNTKNTDEEEDDSYDESKIFV